MRRIGTLFALFTLMLVSSLVIFSPTHAQQQQPFKYFKALTQATNPSGLNYAGTLVYNTSTTHLWILTGLNNATGSTWVDLGSSGSLGIVAVANGGTGLATLTAHKLIIGNGTSPVTLSAVGASNTLLHGNTGADPTYSAIVNGDITNATIDLTAKVTGVLPTANGGTGSATVTGTGLGVLQTSPTLVTPTLGAATATSIAETTSDNIAFLAATNAGCLATPTTVTIASPQLYVRAALNNTVYSVTTNSAAGSFEIDCDISGVIPTRTTASKGATVTEIDVLYGSVTNAPTSIANANFSIITYPAVGGSASGTVSSALAATVTPGMSHGTPVTTTTGQCVNEGNVLTTPLQLTALVPRLTYSQVFSQSAAAVTNVQVCGFLVRYTNSPM